MPKTCFPESYNCESSVRMNCLLRSKLREYAKALRDLVDNGASDDELRALIKEQMTVIYRIIGICLGIPSEKFTWEYYDKAKNYHCVGPITPLEFYENFVKSQYNVNDKVCLVTDPRPNNPYDKLYTVDCLGNVVGGKTTRYNNQPVELLMKLCAESIKNNEPVWFGCDVNKRLVDKQGIHDVDAYNFNLMFGTDIHIGLSKADRLLYGDSMMVHAMAFTAVSIDVSPHSKTREKYTRAYNFYLVTPDTLLFQKHGKIKKFRIENSWGEDYGQKGYHVASADWFSDFVFEAVIDKKYIPADVMDVFNQEPVTLPAWDPMGTLAH